MNFRFTSRYKRRENEKWRRWKVKRRYSLQASEVAAVLKKDPRRGPLTIWNAKVNGENDYDNDWMKYGRDVEGAIANMYAAKTGRAVNDLGATKIHYHSEIPWIGATLDRETYNNDHNPGPLELKSVGTFDRPKQWIAEPPINYEIQLQVQMACTGASWGALAGLFSGYQLVYRDFEFNQSFFDTIYPVLKKFWECVISRTPPPGTGKDIDVIKRLYNQSSGTTVALGGEQHWMDADEWTGNKRRIKSLEKRNNEIEVYFRSEMKNHTYGALLDGSRMTLKTTKRKEYTKTVKATEFRTLRRSGVKK